MPLKNGYLVNKRYKIKDFIGQGGFAHVYLAIDTELEANVALKEFNPISASTFGDSETMRIRFEQEARIARQLQHPHIIVIHDIFSVNDTPYIVMPYVAESLDKLLSRSSKLLVRDAYQIMRQICQGMAYAHIKHRVIHCDLKPGNILLDKGQAKITDFGIAHIPHDGKIQANLRDDLNAGTIAYMPPEQLPPKSKRDDARIDVYALGALFFELLTGEAYLEFGLSEKRNKELILKEQPRFYFLRDVPKPLTHIIEKALSKNPEERYANAQEMLKAFPDLNSILSQKTTVKVNARPPDTIMSIENTEKIIYKEPETINAKKVSSQADTSKVPAQKTEEGEKSNIPEHSIFSIVKVLFGYIAFFLFILFVCYFVSFL